MEQGQGGWIETRRGLILELSCEHVDEWVRNMDTPREQRIEKVSFLGFKVTDPEYVYVLSSEGCRSFCYPTLAEAMRDA